MNDGDGPRDHRIRLAGLQQAASCIPEGEDDRVLKAGPELARLGDVERESWQSHDASRQRRQTEAWYCPAWPDRAQRHPIEPRQAWIFAGDRDERGLMASAAALERWRREDETDGNQASTQETQHGIRGQPLAHERGQGTGGRGRRAGTRAPGRRRTDRGGD